VCCCILYIVRFIYIYIYVYVISSGRAAACAHMWFAVGRRHAVGILQPADALTKKTES